MPTADEPVAPGPAAPDGPPPLAQLIDLLMDAVCVVDPAGRFLYVSAAFESIFGYRPDEIVGHSMIDLVLPEDRERTLSRVDRIVAGDDPQHFENRYRRKDGRIVDIMWSARWSPAHRVRVAVARDVTDKKRAELVQTALYAIAEAAYAVEEDLEPLLDRVRPIVGALMPVAEIRVARPDGPSMRSSGDADAGTHPAALATEVILTGGVRHLNANTGAIGADAPNGVAVAWLGMPLGIEDQVVGALLIRGRPGARPWPRADDVELLHFVAGQIAAAMGRADARTALQRSARHDPLTELPNRNLVRDRVKAALARARRDETLLAVLYLDVDRFKSVNDRFGHAVGDRLLGEVAHRLVRSVRESDTVGRMGGDEFVVLLGRIHNLGDASTIAEKIRATLAEPFDLGRGPLSITSSIGIAQFPEHGGDYEQLIDRADRAMYAAKQDGGNCCRVTTGAGEPVPPR